MSTLLQLLGYLCYAFGIIDFLGMIFRYDLTGTPVSPIIAGVVGTILIKVGSSFGGNKHQRKYKKLMSDSRYRQANEILVKEYDNIPDLENDETNEYDKLKTKAMNNAANILVKNGINQEKALKDVDFLLMIHVLSGSNKA